MCKPWGFVIVNEDIHTQFDAFVIVNEDIHTQFDAFVIVNEDIHTQFDAFVSSMPLLSQGCYLQCGPLLQYSNTHMRPIPATVVQLFGDEYLFLHYADVDTLCEWVFKASEEFEKHNESAEDAAEHPVESELKEGRKTNCKCTSRKPKLWMTFDEFQLYEADR